MCPSVYHLGHYFAPWPRNKTQDKTNGHLLSKTTTGSPYFKSKAAAFWVGMFIHSGASLGSFGLYHGEEQIWP